jgi:glycosyltransferase involved in cell wall biosynthesis
MILFAGALYRPENLTAVDFLLSEVMPRVWQHEPCAHLHLVGAGAPAQLVQQTKGLPVVIHGYQERLSDFYARATLAVAPLFTGGGVIVKLLEALAYGVPTVASSIANEGIGATPEQEVLLADDAATFAKQILALLRSSELRARLSQQAKLFVQRHFNLQESVAELVQDYQALLAQHT